MGYECPVCGVPQADGGHLANHMAFTALVHEGDHEAWLDETVPGWSEEGETELAAVLTEQVEQVETAEYPQVFEDTTTDGHHEHAHEHDQERSGELFDSGSGNQRGQRHQRIGSQSPALDGEAQAVLERARQLTDERLSDDNDQGRDDNDNDE